MNKDKIIMIISIGFTALVLSAVTFTQFKTVEQTDITAIETMRETELRTELSSWKTKYDEIALKLGETENTIAQYRTELSSASDASEVAKQEVKDFEKYLGYTDLQGQGVVVTLQDNEFKNIESYDLKAYIFPNIKSTNINGGKTYEYRFNYCRRYRSENENERTQAVYQGFRQAYHHLYS